ncbi:fibronectin type III domain-containing protein [Micromonospora parva]|uniref:fibronectin type III domain-containing protein n=1 Tax=Micromonospora parva TaxID=1464048 RepID=UPI00371FDA67
MTGLVVPTAAYADDPITACDVAADPATSFSPPPTVDPGTPGSSPTHDVWGRIGCARDSGSLRTLATHDSDLVMTIDLPGVPGADGLVQESANRIRAAKLQGQSLGDYLHEEYRKVPVVIPEHATDGGGVDFDGSAHAVGSSLVLVVPRGEVGTTATWWQKMIAQWAGYAIRVIATGVCLYFMNLEAAALARFCMGVGGFFGAFSTDIFNSLFDKRSVKDPHVWGEALGLAIGAFAQDFGSTTAATFTTDSVGAIAVAIQRWLRTAVANLKNWGSPLTWLRERMPIMVTDLIVAARRSGVRPPTTEGLKVMVVGDSMSQGAEGDWTWRYRLWEWLVMQGVQATFVGPYTGTSTAGLAPSISLPPQVQGAEELKEPLPNNSGGYHANAQSFNRNHFAIWGRQAAQSKNLIRAQVATYQPDMLLVGLGFNDLGWFVSGPEGTLASMKTLVDEARLAKPDIKFALANVPQRTDIGRVDLPANTDIYNRMLAAAIPTWSTSSSPVKLVDWRGNYSCEVSGCPAGYDGLHPNALGEYQIAQAFARTLHNDYGLGQSIMTVPTSIPSRSTPAPVNVAARTTPGGITVTWDTAYGVLGYQVRQRLVGQTAWTEGRASGGRYDKDWTIDGQEWEFEVRANNGDAVSAWSATVRATARPQTAPSPPDIVATPTATGVQVSWGQPTGPYADTINLYEVIVWDRDTPGSFIQSIGVNGRSVHYDGLEPGHRYGVWVASWNAAGRGLPGGGQLVVIGGGAPAAPTNLTVTSIDPTTVQLYWTGSNQAGGYRVWGP